MKNYCVFIPSNLDVDQIMDDLGITNNRKRTKDVLHYIVGQIVRQNLRSATRNENPGSNGFQVNLKAKWFKKAFGKRYRWYVNTLIEGGVIVRGSQYFTGGFSKPVQLVPKYLMQATKQVEITDLKLKRSIERMFQEMRKERGFCKSEGDKLKKWLKKDHLQIDAEAAKEWIATHAVITMEKIILAGISEREKKLLIQNVLDAARGYLDHCDRLNAGMFEDEFNDFDDFGYRFHSVLTNLKGELRGFLTCNGQSLWSVDIKNSQPFLLLPLLYGFGGHRMSEEQLQKIKDWMIRGPKKKTGRKKDTTKEEEKRRNERQGESKMLHLSYEDQAGSWFQRENSLSTTTPQFSQLVLEGNLYEWIEVAYKGKYFRSGVDRFASRDTTKKEVLQFLFHNNKKRERYLAAGAGHSYKSTLRFAQDFPTEFKIMERYKQKDYRDLCRCLQRIESFIVLQMVVGYTAKHLRSMPYYTIHDSVLTTEPFVHILEGLLLEMTEKVTGYKPRLEVKKLTPESAWASLEELRNESPDLVVHKLKEKMRQNRKRSKKRLRRMMERKQLPQ